MEKRKRMSLVMELNMDISHMKGEIPAELHTCLIFFRLCGTPTALSQATHAVVYNSGQSQLGTMLEVASMRLLQILAITTG